jgi:transposase
MDPMKEKKSSGSKASKGKRRSFAYTFRLMDMESRMYIAFGSTMRSEKEAYDRSTKMLESLGIYLESARLDRYYFSPFFVNKMEATKVYVVPMKNATLN